MNLLKSTVIAALLLTSTASFAQQAAAPAAAQQAWNYKTKQLSRADVDALLLEPGKVLVLDVRRPDELPTKGSFPVFLSI